MASLDLLLPLAVVCLWSGRASLFSLLQTPPGSTALMPSIHPAPANHQSTFQPAHSLLSILTGAHSPNHWPLQGVSDTMLDGSLVIRKEMDAKYLQGPGVRHSKDRYAHLRVIVGSSFRLTSLLFHALPLLSPIRCPVPPSGLHSSAATLHIVCFPMKGPTLFSFPNSTSQNIHQQESCSEWLSAVADRSSSHT